MCCDINHHNIKETKVKIGASLRKKKKQKVRSKKKCNKHSFLLSFDSAVINVICKQWHKRCLHFDPNSVARTANWIPLSDGQELIYPNVRNILLAGADPRV